MQASSITEHDTGSIHDDVFNDWVTRINVRILRLTEDGRLPVFETSKTNLGRLNLWETYLDSLPLGEVEYHTCNCCRHFIERYGHLAVLSEEGELTSLIWGEADAPEPYKDAAGNMAQYVRRSKVIGPYLTAEKVLGTPVTGVWTHFAISVPVAMRFKGLAKAPHEAMAEKRQDLLTVRRALAEFSVANLEQAVSLLQTDALYRSEKLLGQAEWLLKLARQRHVPSGVFANQLQLAVATAPAGFCHPRSSMIGTLLEDLEAGKPLADVSKSFATKMHPLRYQRPQAAPAAGTISQAEALVEKMGLAPALRRRFARLDEVEALWRPAAVPAEATTGVFGHLQAKGAVSTRQSTDAPTVTMTWEKFARTLLPEAREIQFRFQRRAGIATLVTAVDPEAPPLLAWDRDDCRNPVSSYVWFGGSTANEFGLSVGYVNVAAVTLKPHMWNEQKGALPNMAQGVVFLLEGAAETRSAGLAIFPENLRGELHGVRSVIEAFSKKGEIEGLGYPTASGPVLVAGSKAADIHLRVTNKAGVVSNVLLDRWD